jgi:hypothetical protein
MDGRIENSGRNQDLKYPMSKMIFGATDEQKEGATFGEKMGATQPLIEVAIFNR